MNQKIAPVGINQIIIHILGELEDSASIIGQILDNIQGEKSYYADAAAYDFETEPQLVLLIGRKGLPDWVELTAAISRRAKSNPCFMALTDAMEYREQLFMAQKHAHFELIQPCLGLQACLQEVREFFTYNCLSAYHTDKVELIVVDAETSFNQALIEQALPPSLKATFVNEFDSLFSLIDSLSIDIIFVNAGRIKTETADELKVIASNAQLKRLPLVIYGDQQAQKGLALSQMLYTAFLTTPINNASLEKLVSELVNEARKKDELNKQLLRLRQIDTQMTAAIDSHAIVSRTDQRGVITYVNPLFCEISQYSKNELIGQTHSMINSAYHPKTFFVEMWQTIAGGEIWRGLVRNRKKDGSYYWVDSTIVPMPNVENNGYDYLSIRTEITEIIRGRERFSEGQHVANIGLLDWNLENNEIYCTDVAAKLLGYKNAGDIRSIEQLEKHIHPFDQRNHNGVLDRSIANDASYETEYRVTLGENQIHWIKEKGEIKLKTQGEPKRLTVVISDITEQKMFEMALESARVDAEKASLSKSKFLASMSHELRTPMNAIIGFAQLLQMNTSNPLNAIQLDNVVEILSASRHLLQLIDEVLNLAEIESGRINLTMRSVNLGEVLHETLSLSKPIISKMKVSVELLYNDEVINAEQLESLEVLVRADSIRIKQIFLNLISNACKYNRANGKVTIDIKRNANNTLTINIKDTGMGIEYGKQTLLFQPFSRLGAESSEVEGTGIGLVITKQLIELMGGSIDFHSEEKVGSEFWITIPIEERRLEERGDTVDVERQKALRGSDNHEVKEKHVLYVEDNPANLRLVSQLLGRMPNLKLSTASCGRDGLQRIDTTQFDLILLDINLPDMSGIRIIRELRANSEYDDIPVAAVSANAMPDEIQRALNAGFDSYITKPIDISHFMVTVDQLLN